MPLNKETRENVKVKSVWHAVWLYLLFKYKELCKSGVISSQFVLCDLLLPNNSESWFPFCYRKFYQKYFILDVVIPTLFPFLT